VRFRGDASGFGPNGLAFFLITSSSVSAEARDEAAPLVSY
jgi:hypothetical protein